LKFRKIQDDGSRYFEKSKNRHILATVGPIDTKYGTLTTFLTLPSLKVSNFQKSKMAAGRRSEKIEKLPV